METIEKFRAYSPDLKDSLCRLYRYIDKFKDVTDPNRPHLNDVGFTVRGVAFAYDNITILPCTEKYATKFMHTLDLVKVLVDEQPSKTYEISYNYYGNADSETPDVTYREVIRSYDNNTIEYKAELLKNENTPNLKVIEIKVAQ